MICLALHPQVYIPLPRKHNEDRKTKISFCKLLDGMEHELGQIIKLVPFSKDYHSICVFSSQFITFFYKGITSTDTRSSSKNPNNPEGLSKGNEFESNQHQEPYGTDIIFGAVNNDAEHPYELTSNR